MSNGSYLNIVSDLKWGGFHAPEKVGSFEEFMAEFAGAVEESERSKETDNGIVPVNDDIEEDEVISDSGIVPYEDVNEKAEKNNDEKEHYDNIKKLASKLL